MNQATLEALKDSIEKWEKIVAGTGEDVGCGNCALCQLFIIDDYDDECLGCPVSEKTNLSQCNNTPYMKWYDHHESVHNITRNLKIECKICKCHAKAEVKFLKSLLPKGHNETSKKSKS